MRCADGHDNPFIDGKNVKCMFCGKPAHPYGNELLSKPSVGVVPGVRDSQVKLATAIENAMRGSAPKFLMAEAPTGVGKSYAALANALTVEGRVLLVTAKKSLCHQYVATDAPYILGKLKEADHPAAKHRVHVRYGAGNYACPDRIHNDGDQRLLTFLKTVPSQRWDDSTNGTYSSDHSADSCVGPKCELGKQGNCRFRDDLAIAGNCKVLIVNPWLFGLAISLRLRKGAEFSLLGEFDHVIIDEAHKLNDGVRAAFESNIPERRLERLITFADAHGVNYTIANTEIYWQDMFDQLRRKSDDKGFIDVQKVVSDDTLVDTIKSLIKSLSVVGVTAGTQKDNPAAVSFVNRISRLITELGNLIADPEDILNAISLDPDTGHLRCSPVRTNSMLSQYYSLEKFQSVTFMSATLTVGGNTKFFQREFGVDQTDCEELILPTVFNYKKQSLVYCSPATKPVPGYDYRGNNKGTRYRQHVADEVLELTNASQGNALVLFTSRAHMLAVAELLYLKTKHPLIIQERSAAAAYNKYMATDNSILFGLKSFFEGVNIPGKKLSLVCLTNLPFPGRSDPVLQIQRAQAEKQWFNKVDLPQCEIDLRQGAGRLIRSATDKGVLAILDSRVMSKRYGARLLNAVGMPNRTSNLKAAVKTLESLHKIKE